jgi:hypothetical protein
MATARTVAEAGAIFSTMISQVLARSALFAD